MIKKSKTNSLWILCGLLITFSQINLMADERWQHYKEGESTEKVVTTTFVNKTNKSLWLQTGAVSMNAGIGGLYGYNPPFPEGGWTPAGKTAVATSNQYAPEGKGFIYYTNSSYETIALDGKNRTYNLDQFNVDVKAVPIKVYYASYTEAVGRILSLGIQGGWTGPWTYTYYNYTITVTPK